jgi:hypothetical protein
MADDQQQSSPSTNLKQQINPNNYEVDENMKVELGPDGKPNKLKDAFLLRPPNN